MIKQVYKFLMRFLFKLIVLSILLPQSWWRGIKSLSKADKILVEKKYNGEKILLIALYEKGKLRNDIQRLLKTAKKLGFYIVGVNTAVLKQDVCELLDCYIERFNYGRDFGSYKTGFNYIFNKKYHLQCPRLLMINDSVYYESTRSEKFLLDLMNSDTEVLGATENHQIEHHLGSFCISIDNRILKHEKFLNYWQSYRNSELRPMVIKNGEMKLSICLKHLASSPDNFRALYDMTFISKLLDKDEKYIHEAIILTRQGRPHWPWLRLEVKNDWVEFISKKYLNNADFGFSQLKKLPVSAYQPVSDLNNVELFLRNQLKIHDDQLHQRIHNMFRAKIVEAFRWESQIHQNNVFLLHVGLPIIKLDGYYRGVLIADDVFNITKQMEENEADELQRLLFSKSYGGDTLFGWKRILFNFGFL